MIELYTKSSCQSCVVAKRVLTEKNIPYKEYAIGVDIDRDDVLKKFEGAKVVPIVVVDGKWIGSKEQLIEWIDNGDVTQT